METAESIWARVCARLMQTAYVQEGAYEFEQQDGRLWLHFHGSLQACVTAVQAAAVWARSSGGAWVKLVADKAGTQVTARGDHADIGLLFCILATPASSVERTLSITSITHTA